MLADNASIMAFGAHAADFTFRAGGTLIRYIQHGARVKAYCATFGEHGESKIHWQRPDTIVEEVKAIRREEVTNAARILGVEVECLDLGDAPLQFDRTRLLDLAEHISAFQPEVILTHWSYEPTNPDHQALSQAVIHATQLARSQLVQEGRELRPVRPQIFLWEPDIPAQPILGFTPDTYIDISAYAEQKFAAVAAYADTQPGLRDRWPDRGALRALEARNLGGLTECRYAEAFKRFKPYAGAAFV